MNKYKNTKTGAIINSPCILSGGDWIKVELEDNEERLDKTEVTEELPKETEKTGEVKEEEEEITKKQIMQELDAMGIKYNPRDRKDVLYKLMLGE